jgi:hypothetical protein
MYPYTHIEPEIKTLGALIKRDGVKLFSGINTSKQFLDFLWPPEGTKGKETEEEEISLTNWERLELKLVTQGVAVLLANRKLYNEKKYDEIKLPYNITFYIPVENIVRDSGIILQDKTIVKIKDFSGFIAQELDDLFQNSDYKQITERTANGLNVVANRGCTAYMWVRAAGTEESEGEWLNISAFIHNQQTFVGVNGGNFTIDIAPIVAGYEYGKWSLDNATVKGLQTAEFNDTYTATSFINKKSKDLLERNRFFFHTAIQANDLVYIRFEDLASDAKNKAVDSDFKLSGEAVARQGWDMIGMVDTVPQVVNSVDNNVLIRITGRDLIKAWIDDECVFFPEEYATAVFANIGDYDDGKLIKRLFGRLIDFSAFVQTSIAFNLQFILNQLSNTGYVSNKAFSGYPKGDRTQIQRRMFNFPDEAEFGSLNTKSNDNRQPTEDVESEGIWKIIKLVVDENVRSRRVVDDSIFASQGSLLNFVRKVCQEPLVEFITDTYGNQFYLTARKPPYDKKSLTSLVYDVEVEKGSGDNKTKPDLSRADQVFSEDLTLSNLTLSIDEGVVFNENLTYETRAYAWYSYNPKGLLSGVTQDMSWAYIKAVQFKEYADVWGSKPFQQTSNYVMFFDYQDVKSPDSVLQYENQALQDLKYIVDSNAYLPFTRKGSITIHGDRRFKRGMFCHYLPTNEVFLIDSVQQRRDITNGSVDRVTTLTVSRGMIEPYIRGVGGKSYFNIIDTEAPDVMKLGEANKILSKWKVNPDVFNFFLHRKQWVDPKVLEADNNAAINSLL